MKDNILTVISILAGLCVGVFLITRESLKLKPKTKKTIGNIEHYNIMDNIRAQHINKSISKETFIENIRELNSKSNTTTHMCNGIDIEE